MNRPMDLHEFKNRLLGKPSIPPAALRRFAEGAKGKLPASAVTPERQRPLSRRHVKALAERTVARLLEQGRPERRRLREELRPSGDEGDRFRPSRGRVLGEKSANGRRYLPEAMRAALPMYLGAKVFLDHPDRPNVSRSVKDLIGTLENVAQDAGGLSVDLSQSLPPLRRVRRVDGKNCPAP